MVFKPLFPQLIVGAVTIQGAASNQVNMVYNEWYVTVLLDCLLYQG